MQARQTPSTCRVRQVVHRKMHSFVNERLCKENIVFGQDRSSQPRWCTISFLYLHKIRSKEACQSLNQLARERKEKAGK